MERREKPSSDDIELAQIELAGFLRNHCNKSMFEINTQYEALKITILYLQVDSREISRIFLDLRQKLIDLKNELTADSSEAMLFCYDCMIELILKCLPEQIANRLETIAKRR